MSENSQARSPDALFFLKKVDNFFGRRAQNTGRQRQRQRR